MKVVFIESLATLNKTFNAGEVHDLTNSEVKAYEKFIKPVANKDEKPVSNTEKSVKDEKPVDSVKESSDKKVKPNKKAK